MATLRKKIEVEHKMRQLLEDNQLPQPDAVEYGYGCIRLFYNEQKLCLIVDIDDPEEVCAIGDGGDSRERAETGSCRELADGDQLGGGQRYRSTGDAEEIDDAERDEPGIGAEDFDDANGGEWGIGAEDFDDAERDEPGIGAEEIDDLGDEYWIGGFKIDDASMN